MQHSDFTIREYKPADKMLLLDIMKLNVPKYFAEAEIADFNFYLDNSIDKYFVIEINNQIIGSGGINFDTNNSVANISWDIIHPKFHNKGIGKKLLIYRIELLNSERNFQKIVVRTSQLAYAFYQKNGFVLKEKVTNYWAEGYDLYYMIYE